LDHSKKRKYNIYIYIYLEEIQKIITVKRGCQNAQKMAKNWLRRYNNTKIKI
jgi:hypothetical protein